MQAQFLPSVNDPLIREVAFEVASRMRNNKGANEKLGEMYSWSIPPVLTCPGKTALCEGVCYSRWIYAYRTNVRMSWDRSYDIARMSSFRQVMTAALGLLSEGILRIHVSGDFFDRWYAEDWIEALRANTHIKPFAFTRSWRDPEILKALSKYGWPKWLHGSTDAETGLLPAGIREATMSETKKRQVKEGLVMAPKLVCPEQMGHGTCTSCGRCPLFKVGKDNKLVPLPASAEKIGVEFLLHK